MSTILIATRNPIKVKLYAPVFERYGFSVASPGSSPDRQPPPETGQTPLENALAKARHFASSRHPLVFAHDAGLEIDALNGEPGVGVRRWNGVFDDSVSDAEWLSYLMERLTGIPADRRTARFVSAWVLAVYPDEESSRLVTFPFLIASEPVRPIEPGSPLSAVRIGTTLEDDLVRIHQEWDQWGILKSLARRFGGRRDGDAVPG